MIGELCWFQAFNRLSRGRLPFVNKVGGMFIKITIRATAHPATLVTDRETQVVISFPNIAFIWQKLFGNEILQES